MDAFYSPPRYNITNIIFTDCFNIIKNNFIIDGTINPKHNFWGSRANNLYNYINKNNINILLPPKLT